jgi:Ca-activated chloride channel family protein
MIHVRTRDAGKAARVFLKLTLFACHLSLLTVSLSAQQPQPGAPAAGADDTVRLTVTVTDEKGRFVSGLRREHFAVSEGKTRREISLFDDQDEPMSICFLIDVSGSMRPQRIATAKLIVGRFIQMSHPRSEYFIGEFGAQTRALTDWTNDPDRLLDGLRQVAQNRAKGNTALFDACAFALDRLAQGRHPKRVLFIVTDGQDNTSRTSFNELRRRVQGADVLIYAVGIVERGEPNFLSVEGQALLDELTSQSGGVAFFPDGDKKLIGAAERIAIELRHQYVIGFAAGDGGGDKSKWRKVRIKVTPPNKSLKGVSGRSREGYFLPRAAP